MREAEGSLRAMVLIDSISVNWLCRAEFCRVWFLSDSFIMNWKNFKINLQSSMINIKGDSFKGMLKG